RMPLNRDWGNDRRMAEQAEQVSTTGLVDTKQPKRRQYSEALKRQMVAETQAPGASVSIVARRHDVNSNQLFRWRRQLLPKAVVESGAMVPVEIAADGDRLRRPDRDGVIEITFGCGARVRLRGEVSSETLRQGVERLRWMVCRRALGGGWQPASPTCARGSIVWRRRRRRYSGRIHSPVTCFAFAAAAAIWSSCCGGMATGCVCLPSVWSADDSSGHGP